MTLFKGLMRLLASAAATFALALAPQLIAFFQGPAPSDIPMWLWGMVGTAVVFGINWLVGKIPVPAFVLNLLAKLTRP